MEARFTPSKQSTGDGKARKKYFDKNFKNNLAKSLKMNRGEPENIGKIKG